MRNSKRFSPGKQGLINHIAAKELGIDKFALWKLTGGNSKKAVKLVQAHREELARLSEFINRESE